MDWPSGLEFIHFNLEKNMNKDITIREVDRKLYAKYNSERVLRELLAGDAFNRVLRYVIDHPEVLDEL